MSVGIGLIGAGAIGRSHARRIGSRIRGADIVAVYDFDAPSAAAMASVAPAARIHASAEALVQDPAVTAVLVASPAVAHAEHVLLALRAGKFVFCEKPLATTAADCLRIVRQEMEAGRRLLQLGFMRRFDDGYVTLKRLIEGGDLGEVLMVHAAHRNVQLLTTFQNSMAVTDCLIHEIDALRWLTGEEFVSVQVIYPKRTRHAPLHLKDPQIFLMEGHRGVHFDVEIAMNARYAYDIVCELVCEEGVVSLPKASFPRVSRNGLSTNTLQRDWDQRFDLSFTAELQAFVDGIYAGRITGPSCWDGCVAALVADACVAAQNSHNKEMVNRVETPFLYAAEPDNAWMFDPRV